MSKSRIPFGAIPDTDLLPDGIFRFKVREMKDTETKEREGKVQKRMFRLVSEVVAPESHKGLLYFDNFVVGTDDDPDADELATWQTSIGGRGLKKLSKALGVPFGDEEDPEVFCNTIKDSHYMATVVQKVDEKEGPYKGTVRNNVTKYWALGEREAALANGADTTTKGRTTQQRTSFRPATGHVEE